MSTKAPAEADVVHALAALDRRTFLRLTGALAAAGLLPAGCGALPSPLAPPPGVSLVQLTPRTYATFQAAALRLLGPGPAALIESRAVDPGRIADAWLARLPALAPQLRQGLLALEFATWPLIGKLSPFTALAPGAQDAVLDELMRSRWEWKQALFKGVKSFACLTFYGTSEARALTGYPGPFGGPGGAANIAEAMRWSQAGME